MTDFNKIVTEELTATERMAIKWPMNDTLRMEAAMVIWENVDEMTGRCGSDDYRAKAAEYRENVGTCYLRHDVMVLVEPLHIAWAIWWSAGDRAASFDWEFTPWFLRNCVEWTHNGPKLVDGWGDMVRNASEDEVMN